MIVTRSSFEGVLATLMQAPELSLDTETTGLRPYHDDRLFSIIIGVSSAQAFYFNFQAYPGQSDETLLGCAHLRLLGDLFDRKDVLWFLQNAKFDMRMLAREGLFLAGQIHCTKALGRVEYNEYQSYSLDAQLERIGLKKDDAVKKYVEEHGLYTKAQIPGKAQQVKLMHYEHVPFGIIQPYGETDGTGTFALGRHQIRSIESKALAQANPTRNISLVMANERRLTHTVFRMEHVGCLIDRDFCKRAIDHLTEQQNGFEAAFKHGAGEDYKSSPVLFQRVFESERGKWHLTEKNNPSFESDVLKRFENPVASVVLGIREAKSKLDFFQGFLYHADRNGRVHPTYSPDGAAHGRFSSSEPNFQNLTDEEGLDTEFKVRRAIVPTPGFKLLSVDYQQFEYLFMLEMACRLVGHETELARLVKGGLDVHEATAQVASKSGVEITRKAAKTSNFLTLYGGGNQKLADGLSCSLAQAKAIRDAVFRGAPEIKRYINHLMRLAESQGYITNWLGRLSYFPNRSFAYRAPNYHCSGGCADIVKIAMNGIDDLLSMYKSRMVCMVHDELIFEIAEGEESVVENIQYIMESVYPSKYLKFTTSASWSDKSLGDLA